MKKYFVLIFLLAHQLILVAQSDSTIWNDVQISLLTCDPSDGIEMYFGHSAIRVKSPGQDIVFNYGTFDFDTPNFVLKFMRGQLPYALKVNRFGTFISIYNDEKRAVYEQIFNLNIKQKQDVFEFLKNNAKPENAYYKYDFFFDNCATRIRDVFQSNLTDSLHFPTYKTKTTFRNILHEYLEHHPWTKLGIDIIIGSKADRTATTSEQMFIPDYLSSNLGNTMINKAPLTSESSQILLHERITSDKPSLLHPMVIGLMAMLWLWLLYYKSKFKSLKILRNTIYSLFIIGGLVITFLWFFTDHDATKINYNIFWINPLIMMLFFTKGALRNYILMVFIIATILCTLLMSVLVIPQQHPSLLLSLVLLTALVSDYLQGLFKMKTQFILQKHSTKA